MAPWRDDLERHVGKPLSRSCARGGRSTGR
ncbi:hypothetical protein [Sphingobium cupriresistens]|nr:hypothetical protein [Sphingobium cupriresistens]